MCCKKHSKDNTTQKPVEFNEKEDHNTQDLEEETKLTTTQSTQDYQKEGKDHVIILNKEDDKLPAGSIGSEVDDNDSIDLELQAVLARLVSDYRAIFAIEDEIHHGESHCFSNSYQEGANVRYG